MLTKRKTKFIEGANIIHNNKYDYSKVEYVDIRTKLTIICPIHGEFKQKPTTHIHTACGCQQCGANKTRVSNTTTVDDFIKTAHNIHNNKYNYSNVDYKTTHTNVKIICPIHGEFKQKPANHICRSSGCPKCQYDKLSTNNLSMTTPEFINKCVSIHGNKYDYSIVEYKGHHKKIKVICPTHGFWVVTANNHIVNNSCCPQCSNKYSKNSIAWLNALAKDSGIHIQHGENGGEYSIPNTPYHADGYCAETNTIYEFHGDYWYGNPNKFASEFINQVKDKTKGELYRDTIIRENEIKALGYNLVVMWEYDHDQSQKLLKQSARINTKHN